MNVLQMIVNSLSAFNPSVVRSETGSVYVSFENIRVKQIRIANHPGRKVGGHHWELRSDSSSKRTPKHRIYNSKSVVRMCEDFKSFNQEKL